MSKYQEFDLSKLKTQPIAERFSKVKVEDFAKPPHSGRSFVEFLSALPNILSGPDIARIAKSVVKARKKEKAVVVAIGGHVIKTGCAPVLIELMRTGCVTAMAGNGAVGIHDSEIALFGTTSEDVVAGLQSGEFGMVRETAEFYNSTIREGVTQGMGIGEALGRRLEESMAPHRDKSLLASAWRYGVPFTLHISIGSDIMHFHPNADGASLGEGSLRDFRILTAHMANLAHGGVLLNIGSAVVLPEVLLKAVAILRNQLGDSFTDFLGVNFDFIQHYRSNQQVVTRVKSIGGDGIALTGHHEILIPLLGQAITDIMYMNGGEIDSE